MVNEVNTIDNPRLENQLTKLTSLVRQLAIGQHQPIAAVKACGGYQYRKQPYANWLFEGQQFEWPPYRPNPNQGLYAVSRIQFKLDHASKLRKLSIAKFKIPGATIPTTTVVENATTR
ncbi:hypothetical protein CR513_40959, partial [Mucuna pruriens]